MQKTYDTIVNEKIRSNIPSWIREFDEQSKTQQNE